MVLTTSAARPMSVRLYRDHDPLIAALPGMDLGEAEIDDEACVMADRWFRAGVRRVAVRQPVDLQAAACDASLAAVRTICLVRELTSRAIAVEWRLRLRAGHPDEWRTYSHLYPPAELWGAGGNADAAPENLTEWQRNFTIGRCCYRRGPGFIQVHDDRVGRAGVTVIGDPDQLTAVAEAESGTRPPARSFEIVRLFENQRFVSRVGDCLVWLPYRLRRWPLPCSAMR